MGWDRRRQQRRREGGGCRRFRSRGEPGAMGLGVGDIWDDGLAEEKV
jgi:hypothetical protein